MTPRGPAAATAAATSSALCGTTTCARDGAVRPQPCRVAGCEVGVLGIPTRLRGCRCRSGARAGATRAARVAGAGCVVGRRVSVGGCAHVVGRRVGGRRAGGGVSRGGGGCRARRDARGDGG